MNDSRAYTRITLLAGSPAFRTWVVPALVPGTSRYSGTVPLFFKKEECFFALHSNRRENEREPHGRAGDVHGTYEARSGGRPE